MLGQHWLRYGFAVCLVLMGPRLWGAFPVVGRSGGTLAVQTAAQTTWRTIDVGGIVPDQAEARTTANGPGHIRADQGLLSLGRLSRVKYDLLTRRTELVAGQLFCSAPPDQPWTVDSGTARVSISADSEVEIQAAADLTLVVTVLKGKAEIHAPDLAVVTVVDRGVARLRGTPLKPELQTLGKDAEQRVRAWIKQTPPGQGVGQLVIKDAQGSTATKLNIARYHAEVLLQPPVALVKLDQAFYNPSFRQEEGEFVFNLPPGASVSRFAMFVDAKTLIEGEVIERQQADNVYTTIVRSRRDPAILEQIGDNLFKMRIFPIFPRDIKRILLDFTIPLDGRAGQYQFQLPLLSNLKPIWDFRIFGGIRGPTPLASVQCPTIPDVKFSSKSPHEILFNLTRSNYQPESDFVVAFQQPLPQSASHFRHLLAEPLKLPTDAPQGSKAKYSHLHPDGTIHDGIDGWNRSAGTYFQADLPVPPLAGETAPADVLLLLDTSSNGNLDQVRPALQTVLGSLRDQDRFRLMTVDVLSKPLHTGWLTPRSTAAIAAYHQFEAQICLGATDMLAACRSATTEFDPESNRRRIVIYLGDGLDSVNKLPQDKLTTLCAAELAKAKATFFAANTLPPPPPPKLARPSGGGGGGFFQFGPTRTPWAEIAVPASVATSPPHTGDGQLFLAQLTAAAGGRSFNVAAQPAERSRLFEWLLAGIPTPVRITQLTVVGCEPIDLYYPTNLLPGEPFRIAGRKPGLVESLAVTYHIETDPADAQPVTITLNPEGSSDDHLVGRYWADLRLRHLQRLLAAPKDAGGMPAAYDVIVQLSREWSLLTPQTAYLVLETENDYERWNVPRQARRRYWSIEELPPVPSLPDDWLARVSPLNRLDILAGRGVRDSDIQTQFRAVRAALEQGHYTRALSLLDGLRTNDMAVKLNDYAQLRKLAESLQQSARAQQGLGIRQAWFDSGYFVPKLPTGLDGLLISANRLTPNLLQRHPLAEKLLREVDLPAGEMSLTEFADFIKRKLGIHVALDKPHLDESHISIDQANGLPQLKKVTWYNAIRHYLDQINCRVIEERHRLLITTTAPVPTQLQRVLYPIADLLTDQPGFNLADFHDPILERDEEFERRLAIKLKQPVSLQLQAASLEDLIHQLRDRLNENVVVDKAALELDSVSLVKQQVNCDYDQIPLNDVLKWELKAFQLTYHLRHEALVITTPSKAMTHQPLRVYPLVGLLYRDLELDAASLGWNNNFQFGEGSLGFGGMGGSMGFSGGLGGGMGGFGGNFDGEPRFPAPVRDAVAEIPALLATEMTTNESPESVSAEDEADMLNLETNFPIFVGTAMVGDNSSGLLNSIMQQTGGPPDSPWMEADGEGGAISIFHPALTMIAKQTLAAHTEIAEFLEQQRKLQTQRGRHPKMIPLKSTDRLTRGDLDAYALINAIQSTVSEPPDVVWVDYSGEGGTISYDKPRYALSIRQTPEAHDQINALLIRLRRERYALLHGARPWELCGLTNQLPSLLSGPWTAVTDSEQTPKGALTDAELSLLQVRRELPDGQWQQKATAGDRPFSFALKRSGERLQLNWPDWKIEIQGTLSTILSESLQYAELGTWGQALREWLDTELVFWPHRSNRELAALFHVASAPPEIQVAPGQVRLRFTPEQALDQLLWIDVTYDRQSGLPVVWESYQQSKLARRLRFEIESREGQPLRWKVLTETPGKQPVLSGEWTPDPLGGPPLAAPEPLPPGVLVIDGRLKSQANLTAFASGLLLTRQGNHALAADQYRKVLDQYPQHPLAQFLFAWSLAHQGEPVASEKLQAAFQIVVQNAPADLVRLLIQHGSRRLSAQEHYDLLQGRPAEKRDAEEEILLATLSLQLGQPTQALRHAQVALQLSQTSDKQQLAAARLLIEAFMRTGQPSEAFATYERIRQARDPVPTTATGSGEFLAQVLMSFETFENMAETLPFYTELLKRPDSALTLDTRRHLLRRTADMQQGLPRWQALLQAAELLPIGTSTEATEFGGLLGELTAAQDADSVAILSKSCRFSRHRQQLREVQGDVTNDVQMAQEIYWQLHREGYLFRDRLLTVSDRFLDAKRPARAAAIIEAVVRSQSRLSPLERLTLAKCYEATGRPIDAQRALSDE